MSAVARALAQVRGEVPWTGHDLVVVTAPSPAQVDERVDRLRRMLDRTPARVVGVVDDRHLGNLTGTVAAWQALRDDLAPHTTVALVHDAGRASRSTPLTRTADGTRGAVHLGARLRRGGDVHAVDQLGLVVLLAGGVTPTAGHVDLLWGSQLCLADGLVAPRGALSKLVRPATGAPAARDRADLGWFGLARDGAVRDFVAQGCFPTAEAFATWAARWPQVAADVGSASLSHALLDALGPHLTDLPVRPRDLDPQLTRPWVRLLGGGTADDVDGREVARLLERAPHLAVPDAVTSRAMRGPWWRLRHPAEVRAMARALCGGDPDLGLLFDREHPVSRTWLGEVYVDGPELTWDAVAHGVTLGGVTLDHAVVRDAVLAAGSVVARSVVVGAAGRVNARDAVVLQAAGPVEATETVYAGPGVHAGPGGGLPDDGVREAVAWLRQAPLDAPGAAARLDGVWSAIFDDDRHFAALLSGLLVPAGDTLLPAPLAHARAVLTHGWRRLAARGGPDADAFAAGARRTTHPEPVELPDAPRTIAVLSRVSAGADIAVVTPLLLRLRARWPHARLVVIGGRLGAALPADARAVPLSFGRSAGLTARLEAWRACAQAVAAVGADLVVAPASRLDQVGTLPVHAAGRTLQVDLTAHDGTMADRVGRWADATLGPGPEVVPSLALARCDVVAAEALDAQVDLAARVAVKYGVAGDAGKALSADAEASHLLHALARGPVVLDEGWGAEEIAATARLVDAARAAGHTVAAAADADRITRLVTWGGSLPAWAAVLARCRAALGYDSVQGHLAAADKVIDGVATPGTPVTVLFVADAPARFVRAWTPTGRSAVTVVHAEGTTAQTVARWQA